MVDFLPGVNTENEMLAIDSEHPGNTTKRIIGDAFEGHGELGCGFLERVYAQTLRVDLIRHGSAAEIEERVQVSY